MLELFWCCVGRGKEDEKFVEESLYELSTLLRKPPVERELVIRALDEKSQSTVERWSENPVIGEGGATFSEACRFLNESILEKWQPLFIYCQPDSRLAARIRGAEPGAIWGHSQGFISVVYKRSNKFILWHEALHLFRVADCNLGRRNPGPTCRKKNCLMQYAPTAETVGSWPFLCKKARDQLRRCGEKRQLNAKSK